MRGSSFCLKSYPSVAQKQESANGNSPKQIMYIITWATMVPLYLEFYTRKCTSVADDNPSCLSILCSILCQVEARAKLWSLFFENAYLLKLSQYSMDLKNGQDFNVLLDNLFSYVLKIFHMPKFQLCICNIKVTLM